MDGDHNIRDGSVTNGLQNFDSALPAALCTAEALRAAILQKLTTHVGRRRAIATKRDWLLATAIVVRDFAVDRWLDSLEAAQRQGAKRVYYLSLEFLIGRLLFDNLNNLNILPAVREALAGLDVDLDDLRALEPDAALGNGGLGRLAACFMESLATLNIPAYGYGIRYEHGLFRQLIKDGVQHEEPEDWLSFGNPWEFERPEVRYAIGFGGAVVQAPDRQHIWHPEQKIVAAAFDTPVVGWRGARVNTLRLWSALPGDKLRLDLFNEGDHTGAQTQRMQAEAISKVLYPSDSTPAGEELRLRQEYFFVSASLQDLVRRHLRAFGDIATLAEKTAIQLNDTHPAIAVAEMMRILVDLHEVPWDTAWANTRAVFSYTNHTLLPEALETWPVALMERLLPRHMQIIYLINDAHLAELRQSHPDDGGLAYRLSLINEDHGPPRPDEPPCLSRLPPRQRGLRFAHGFDARNRLSGPARAPPRPDRQRHQRHRLPPLAARSQPGPHRPARRNPRPPSAGPARNPRATAPLRGGPYLPAALRRGEAGQQIRARQTHPARAQHHRRPHGPVRRADQAHPRI